MKVRMKAPVLAVVLLATSIGWSTAVAEEPSTAKPAPQPVFRTPLVRDLEPVDQVKALTAGIADREAKNAELAKKLAAVEAKPATIKQRQLKTTETPWHLARFAEKEMIRFGMTTFVQELQIGLYGETWDGHRVTSWQQTVPEETTNEVVSDTTNLLYVLFGVGNVGVRKR